MRIDPNEFPEVPPDLVSSMNYKYREELDEQTLARLSDLIGRGLELKGYRDRLPLTSLPRGGRRVRALDHSDLRRGQRGPAHARAKGV